MPSRHSAAGNDSALFRSSRRTVRAFSGGSTPTRGRVGHECPSPTRSRCRAGSSFVQADPRWCRCRPPPWPSADCCRAVRQDRSTLSPVPGHPPELPRSAVTPSVQRRRIDPVHPVCGWRTWWWRAHSSRASHPSSPVRVPRPAPALHAAFTRHLAVTPWRVPGPSAPRTPGQGTFTPEPDRMHGTHAAHHRPANSWRSRLLPVRCMGLFGICIQPKESPSTPNAKNSSRDRRKNALHTARFLPQRRFELASRFGVDRCDFW